MDSVPARDESNRSAATKCGPETARPSVHNTDGCSASVTPIVFFDGVCGLCNRCVDFVLKRDVKKLFRFAPLQGETARQRLGPNFARDLNTIAVMDSGGTYRRSAAVVRILWQLGGKWRVVAAVLWLVPRPVRDLGYRVAARFRYALFGKHDTCRIPTVAERDQFLP